MDWFWHVLVVCVIVIPVALLWLAIIIELFRRRDLSVGARLAWLVLVLVLPLIGSLVYVIVTWMRGAEGGHDLGEARPSGEVVYPTTISDLTRLDQLRRAGVISDAEFEDGKASGSRR